MTYYLGLSGGYYHDAAACLLKDNEIVAMAEEERFSRRKHHMDSQSATRAVAYCLSYAGIKLQDIKTIAISWNPYWPKDASYIDDVAIIRKLLDPRYFDGYLPSRIKVCQHHLSHAASAFYCSGYKDANILVVDGSGDGISTTLAYGHKNKIEILQTYDFSQSLGWFYEYIAEHIGLGSWQSVGKLMGLAAYGEAIYDFDFIKFHADGYSIENHKLGIDISDNLASEYVNLNYYWKLKEAYKTALLNLGIKTKDQQIRYNSDTNTFEDYTNFHKVQKDLAASSQYKLETVLLRLVDDLIKYTKNPRLCIAGGVGLNCSANGKIAEQSDINELFVQPASGDSGGAIGAAILVAIDDLADDREFSLQFTSAYYGPAFSNKYIYSILKKSGYYFHHHQDIAWEVAQTIAKGKTVGWFQGRMEFGPRALGSRSILADPRKVETRDFININIKHRENWRPLAPSILASEIDKYAINPIFADYMIVAYNATPFAQDVIPATVHVDKTLRPQAVSQTTNYLYHRVLEGFQQITDVPALLNTSFNDNYEPIVCTPLDALRTFATTELDAIALGEFLILKDDNTISNDGLFE